MLDAESALDGLYRSVVMEHYREPQNRRPVEGANVVAEGKNVLCGDDVRIELRVSEGLVEEAGFSGQGCAISMASTSMLTEMLEGLRIEDAHALIRLFTRFIKGERDGVDREALEDLAALEGVSRFPVRVKCALLPFTAVEGSLPVAG